MNAVVNPPSPTVASRLTDRNFVYTPSHHTDIRNRFREMGFSGSFGAGQTAEEELKALRAFANKVVQSAVTQSGQGSEATPVLIPYDDYYSALDLIDGISLNEQFPTAVDKA